MPLLNEFRAPRTSFIRLVLPPNHAQGASVLLDRDADADADGATPTYEIDWIILTQLSRVTCDADGRGDAGEGVGGSASAWGR